MVLTPDALNANNSISRNIGPTVVDVFTRALSSKAFAWRTCRVYPRGVRLWVITDGSRHRFVIRTFAACLLSIFVVLVVHLSTAIDAQEAEPIRFEVQNPETTQCVNRGARERTSVCPW